MGKDKKETKLKTEKKVEKVEKNLNTTKLIKSYIESQGLSDLGPITSNNLSYDEKTKINAERMDVKKMSQVNYTHALESDYLKKSCGNHVDSFNLFMDHILPELPNTILPMELETSDDPTSRGLVVKYDSLSLEKPRKKDAASLPRKGQPNIIPADCREGHFTYAGRLMATMSIQNGRSDKQVMNIDLGNIPVMVSSNACHLNNLSPSQLIKYKEDETERGGYFIMSGNERIIRMLIMPKSNQLIAMDRSSFINRGPLYTKHAVQIRCMRTDLTTLTNTLHYCRDGTCFFRFSFEKNEYLIPMLVIAFACSSDSMRDKKLGQFFCGADPLDNFISERIQVMQQNMISSDYQVHSKTEALQFLGDKFRNLLKFPKYLTDVECGQRVVDQFFLVQCPNSIDKFHCLSIMFQKLMGLVQGIITPENCDALSTQEALLPGQLYGAVVKEALEQLLVNLKKMLEKKLRWGDDVASQIEIEKAITSCKDIDHALGYFMATGTIKSRSGLDLMQVTGFTIVADKLNQVRYLSHFRAIHRGQFFMEMKTTAVRKLLPDSWGFLCPVHTPDGGPCGLLNHLAADCQLSLTPPGKLDSVIIPEIKDFLRRFGVETELDILHNVKDYYPITVEGRMLGYVKNAHAKYIVSMLRRAKVMCNKNMSNFYPAHKDIDETTFIIEKDEDECLDIKHLYEKIPNDLEIVFVDKEWGHIYPGIFLFCGPCRFTRPVKDLTTNRTELIGSFEQIFLKICVSEAELQMAKKILKQDLQKISNGVLSSNEKDYDELKEIESCVYSHREIDPIKPLSIVAALTPFQNHNQSPRCMYQCQMLKQTMGTPYLNHSHRTDNKIYRIEAPQKPMVRANMYNEGNWDTHPAGKNAIVAVISYTGFDMEDSMIINKQGYERGFMNGSVYKQKIIHAAVEKDQRRRVEAASWKFSNFSKTTGEKLADYPHIESDGLPSIGTKLTCGMALCASRNDKGEKKIEKFKDGEDAYVEQVNLISGGSFHGGNMEEQSTKMSLKLRIPRRPMVGDKFASRHGQKGVMATLWRHEDMPFTASGMVPDILFNPHGFPSRMTIGMLIESIAGKAAAITGTTEANATAFRKYRGHYTDPDNNENDPFLENDIETACDPDKLTAPAEYFGKTLRDAGYAYYGTEEMYDGMHGTPMQTHIFMGIIYYQRLRHMVADKAQVRATGPIDPTTKQPVKGRQRHGGIRLGEMERDALIAHGTSYLVNDRLMRCSDYSIGHVCNSCGSLITPIPRKHQNFIGGGINQGNFKQNHNASMESVCMPCTKELRLKNPEAQEVTAQEVVVPFIFRNLTVEMAAMNINLKLKLSKPTKCPYTNSNDDDDNEGYVELV